MNCPKCGNTMSAITVANVEVDRCIGCAGMWFDLLEHEELKGIKGAAEIVDLGGGGSKRLNEQQGPSCPRCNQAMVSLKVHNQPHLTYDQCLICNGVFFDAGEFRDFADETTLEKIYAAIGKIKK